MFKSIKHFVLLIITLAALRSSAQEGASFGERLVFGGNLGLQFGTETVVDIAPIVGYKVTDRFIPGIGLQYIYYKSTAHNFQTSIYGGSVFARYFVLEDIFLHAELQVLNLPRYDFANNEERINIAGILLGGGFRQPIGDRSSFNFMILWDVIEDHYSPYKNPILRAGFAFGI